MMGKRLCEWHPGKLCVVAHALSAATCCSEERREAERSFHRFQPAVSSQERKNAEGTGVYQGAASLARTARETHWRQYFYDRKRQNTDPGSKRQHKAREREGYMARERERDESAECRVPKHSARRLLLCSWLMALLPLRICF